MSRGSSPRMRGALPGAGLRSLTGRIIPAYAGSTGKYTSDRTPAKDHPRVCGEHPRQANEDGCFVGSSPRMRGALWSKISGFCNGRIIPAYAGSTITITRMPQSARDHPRVCGEHPVMHTAVRKNAGSSPRMRGARSGHILCVEPGRIIPAYAGSTVKVKSYRVESKDHPRVCGEHLCRNAC